MILKAELINIPCNVSGITLHQKTNEITVETEIKLKTQKMGKWNQFDRTTAFSS